MGVFILKYYVLSVRAQVLYSSHLASPYINEFDHDEAYNMNR
jgi:hypothetical protein